MQHPILTPIDGGGESQYTGVTLLNEVYDLIRRRLPKLSPDDPHRAVLSWLLTQLGPRLGRSDLVPVSAPREDLQGRA